MMLGISSRISKITMGSSRELFLKHSVDVLRIFVVPSGVSWHSLRMPCIVRDSINSNENHIGLAGIPLISTNDSKELAKDSKEHHGFLKAFCPQGVLSLMSPDFS